MKRLVPIGLVLAVALAAIYLWQRSAPPSGSNGGASPDVVLITIDTMRADRLGRGITPNLDALAARGASYSNARTAVPLTLPAHVSLMTGTLPDHHGVHENGVVFDKKRTTIARRLREAGYRTGAFVGAYVLNRRFGLDDGFEMYDDAVRRDMARAEQLEAERPAAEVIDSAIGWLRQVTGPYFLWVHVYDPHVPYAPPAEFLAKAAGNAYDGEIAYVDAQVGRLLDAIAARKAKTVIAVAGDHGESLGEHGEATHGMLAYDSTLRVPLIIAAEGVATPRMVTSAISLLDLGGSLLYAAGLPRTELPPAGDLLARDGASAADMVAVHPSFAETHYPRRAGWHSLRALADDRWKLIESSEVELYDLASDRGELTNVAAANPTVVQGMRDWIAKLSDPKSTVGKVAPEAAERLRALGYVSGSSAITSDDPKAPNPAKHIAAWAAFEQGLGELQSGRTAQAASTLRALAAQHPGAPVFQSSYARALREAGRTREAVAVYKAAVGKWPTDPALFHDLAVAAREAGDPAEALRAEQAALALDGNSPMAWNGLGLLHADAGRHAEAVSAFEKAATADATNPSYWTNLANARRALNDGRGAESAYRKALELDATYPDALNGLGTLLVQSRRSGDAIPMFEQALKRDPELHEARLNLGIAYHETGQREKAAAAYRELLAKAPVSMARERRAAEELLRQLR